MISRVKIDISQPVSEWYKTLIKDLSDNDFVIVCNSRDDMTWFITNFTQLMARQGGNEVASVYGRHTTNLMSFIYQLNLSLPIGYEIGEKHAAHALYDLLLNFETEPASRFIIWNDADCLYDHDRNTFDLIFESMIVAAYCNRNVISTVKENGTPYKVNQRNVFVFNHKNLGDLEQLLTKEYHIPSTAETENRYIDFNVVELMNSSGNTDISFNHENL